MAEIANETELKLVKQLLKEKEKNGIKIYKKRWFILFLYVVYMVCNSSQWLQYSTIPNDVKKFYKIENWQVDLTSLVFMICYVPLALPAANLMNRLVSLKCHLLYPQSCF